MVAVISLDGSHYSDIIHATCNMRQQVGNLRPALTMFAELEWTRGDHPGFGEERRLIGDLLLTPVHRRAVVLLQRRFGIERVHLAHAAEHSQEDATLRLCGMMRPLLR